MKNYLELDKITVRIGQNTILDQVRACIPRGEVTAIVGPNGGGKTSLIKVLLGSLACSGALVYPSGKSLNIGYVPQRFAFDRGMPLTVSELLAAGLTRWPLSLGIRKKIRQRIMTLLESVHIAHLSDQRIGVLSGGELQRVLLAQALQNNPELLILDEPGAGVDASGEQLFCDLLEDLRKNYKFTQIMVSHNLSLVVIHAEHVILLNKKVIAEGIPCQALTPSLLQQAYGVHMGYLSNCPKHGKTCPPVDQNRLQELRK